MFEFLKPKTGTVQSIVFSENGVHAWLGLLLDNSDSAFNVESIRVPALHVIRKKIETGDKISVGIWGISLLSEQKDI